MKNLIVLIISCISCTHKKSKSKLPKLDHIGRSYDSFTGDVQNKDKQWFIQLFNSLDKKNITEITK